MGGRDRIADSLLLGLSGIEIGGASHNSFGLNTINVDHVDRKKELSDKFDEYVKNNPGKNVDNDTTLAKLMLEYNTVMNVDIVADGDILPFADNSWDFVVSSHVCEHFHNPVKAIREWLRVVKPGGYVYMIVPHKERTFDKDKPLTTLKEIIDRDSGLIPEPIPKQYGHQTVWVTENFVEMCNYYGWNLHIVLDTDQKVGNGFLVVIKK